MPSDFYVSIDDVLDLVRDVMAERFDLRRKELSNGPEKPQSVKKWVTQEFDFPDGADRGDYPKGLVNFDPERRFDRREQDTGDTSEIDVQIVIAFTIGSMSAADLNTMAGRYGDAIAWTLYREAKLVRPSDGTVLPGVFRILPKTMRIGPVQDADMFAVEVRAVVIVDQSFTGAVTP